MRASGAIGLVQIDGIDSGKLADYLWDKQRIVVIPIKHAQFEGIRVTPNVYTTLDEVDVFIDAMKQALAKGSLIGSLSRRSRISSYTFNGLS